MAAWVADGRCLPGRFVPVSWLGGLGVGGLPDARLRGDARLHPDARLHADSPLRGDARLRGWRVAATFARASGWHRCRPWTSEGDSRTSHSWDSVAPRVRGVYSGREDKVRKTVLYPGLSLRIIKTFAKVEGVGIGSGPASLVPPVDVMARRRRCGYPATLWLGISPWRRGQTL